MMLFFLRPTFVPLPPGVIEKKKSHLDLPDKKKPREEKRKRVKPSARKEVSLTKEQEKVLETKIIQSSRVKTDYAKEIGSLLFDQYRALQIEALRAQEEEFEEIELLALIQVILDE